jgi:glyoxylate carboligase
MATKSVSVRIPEESLKELERIATLKGQKVSDVVRDLIVERLTNGSGGGNQLIIEYLEGFGTVLAGIHNEAARSRFYAELMTSYAMDLQSLMTDGKVTEKDAKEALMSRFSNASMQMANESWLRALNYQKPPEGEPG